MSPLKPPYPLSSLWLSKNGGKLPDKNAIKKLQLKKNSESKFLSLSHCAKLKTARKVHIRKV